MIHNNKVLSNCREQYKSPEVSMIGLDNMIEICQSSPVDGEMREGDDNW